MPGRPFVVVALLLALAGAPLVGGRPARAQETRSDRVTIEAEREPLLQILKKLTALHDFNYVASEGALQRAGLVSLRLVDVSFDEALASICDAYGLEARVRGKIVIVRIRDGEPQGRPVGGEPSGRSSPVEPEVRPEVRLALPRNAAPRENRFIPEITGPQAPRLDRSTPPPAAPAPPPPAASSESAGSPGDAASTADVGSQARSVPPTLTPGGGAIVVGLVVDIAADSVRLKETSGDPREYFVAHESDDAARTSKLVQGLKRLKRGDRVALEYRVDGGRAVITNLVGGGKP